MTAGDTPYGELVGNGSWRWRCKQTVACVYSHTNPYLYLTQGIQTQYYNKLRVVISDSICGDTAKCMENL